ncbi:hypothetical protein GGS23DRAFT_224741 [Durotheca rogersii]|uniref:uncharacterized protein n=1 Tax=Durotheca rogersii TaxID=419775 RepID=UPI00221FB5D2|nr:uncharacterized protein GGS23DRAFT_224741 [Durotheca rogersii]KAI5860475.1 hypothetical protein GGS23DRAFT_224741 [Durotheca rogersii]
MLAVLILTKDKHECLEQMSGALPLPSEEPLFLKRPAWLQSLKVKLEDGQINAFEETRPGARTWLRYQVLKAYEKLCGSHQMARDAWAEFRYELDQKPGPPLSGLVLMRRKVETRIILAERRMAGLKAPDPHAGREGSAARRQQSGEEREVDGRPCEAGKKTSGEL